MARRKTGARAWVRVSNRTKDLPASKRRWEVVYEEPTDEFKRRTKGGFTSKADAEKWRDDFTHEARQGSWVDPARGDVLFKPTAVQWLKTYVSRSGKSRGYDQHAQILTGKKSLVVQEFGAMRVGDITHQRVGAWLKAMQDKGRSASTIRHNFYTFRKVMRYAVAEGLIHRDPCGDLRPPEAADMAVEQSTRYALSRDEVEALIGAVPAPWNTYLRLLAESGMRPEEVGGLRLHDVSDDCTEVSIQRVLVKRRTGDDAGRLVIEDMLKTKRSRRLIDLDDETAAELRAYVKAHRARALKWFSDEKHPERAAANPGDALPLFVGVGAFKRGERQRKTGTDLDWLDYTQPVSHGWFAMRHWEAACEAAGIPASAGVHPYDLRHFHISWHVDRLGVPGALTITRISERAGHASTAMTLNRYSHSQRDQKEQTRAALNAARSAGNAPKAAALHKGA